VPVPRVFITNKVQPEIVELLSGAAQVEEHRQGRLLEPGELIARLQGQDAVISYLTEQFGEEVLAACPDIKLIANVAVGYDNVDVKAASSRSILVTNTPGVLDETTADLAFGLLIATARRLPEADQFVRTGLWQRWDPGLMLGVDVHGKTLGVVGFGRIGRAVARRANGFRMKVLYCRRSPAAAPSSQADLESGAQLVTLDQLLEASDFISLHCPLNQETHHLFSRRELSMVKPGCILINTARGSVVDQQALIEALQQGRLRGAGLDVFEDEPHVPPELAAMSQVVLAPHIGSASLETRAAMARLAATGLISAFSGTLPENAVNPEVWEGFRRRAGLTDSNPAGD